MIRTPEQEQRYLTARLVGSNIFGKAGRMTLGMFCATMVGREIRTKEYLDFCHREFLPALGSLASDAKRFEELGMLTVVPQTGGFSRERVWRVNENPAWFSFTLVRSLINVYGWGGDGMVTAHPVPAQMTSARDEMLAMARRLRG